jgi:hypothetical protein
MAGEIELDFDFVVRVMAASEQTFLELENSEGLSQPMIDEEAKGFRHACKDDRLLVFLKGVRYMSLLNASVTLFVNGFVHEFHILARCMDEALEDVVFFFVGLGPDGSMNERQREAMEEFYQEEFADPSVGMLHNNDRRRTPRKVIRAAIASLPGNEVNPHDTGRVLSVIYDTFSVYVHGAYPHIMEFYGGHPPHYHTRGMHGTPHQVSTARSLVTYAHRGIQLGQYAALKLGRQDILDRLYQIRGALEVRYPHLAGNPNEGLAALKRKK